jgi:superfamily I DNA/RNA helicase
MSYLIHPDEWTPIGVEALEPTAFEIVRSNSHQSVVAGPGAGKTELLAQRACYLLQTGICPYPRRILAISFKKDAARNLKERVEQRSYREHALRFDSLTFDAFAKSILDRFRGALPEIWRPTADYEILFPTRNTFQDFLEGLSFSERDPTRRMKVQAIQRLTFQKKHILGSPLPVEGIETESAASWAAKKWWEERLHSSERSQITFPMIGRLAELLLRVNPLIRNSLRVTYSHVFMDEFQDTTHVQYDLVKTAFIGSDTTLTAVGDNKQQIMRWAMALDNAFEDFENDFRADRSSLIMNYRSSPALIKIQHSLAYAIDPNYTPAQAVSNEKMAEDACKIFDFNTPEDEAGYIADIIAPDILAGKLKPRDFVLLVKQRTQDYVPTLKSALKARGVKMRDEAQLQDILAERLTGLLFTFLRLGATRRAGKYWGECVQIASRLKGVAPDDVIEGRILQSELNIFHTTVLRKQMEGLPSSEKEIEQLLRVIVEFFGVDTVKLLYQEYRQGDWFEKVLAEVAKHLYQSCQTVIDWSSALDEFEGHNTVPLMTIHKSKGLEYHTVIFVGLDDSAWWNFRKQPQEDRSAFFVAFSRAKERVFFAYCENRGGRTQIASLYELLQSAGVKTQRIHN